MSPASPAKASNIRVLIVEDSATVRELFRSTLEQIPGMEVVGEARDGHEAIRLTAELKPDVITMDIEMPGLDGLEATRHIMSVTPTPIIIVSSNTGSQELQLTFKALDAGAVAVLQKPYGPGNTEHSAMMAEWVRQVRLMSGVKVVRRWKRLSDSVTMDRVPVKPLAVSPRNEGKTGPKVVAIGASTGGPPAIKSLFKLMPVPLDVSILVVQHISPGFVSGMVEWVQESAPLWRMKIADHEELLQPGHVYFAPDAAHMKLGNDNTIVLDRISQSENGVKPSISVLYRSLLSFAHRGSSAVLLTGMGKDGAADMGALRDAGMLTIAQCAEECVVNGMPAEAVRLGHASHVLPLGGIAAMLVARYSAAMKVEK